MAIVRASCPSCGDVETTTRSVQVLQCADTGTSTYAFACPRCRLRVAKPATDHVVDLLVEAGVVVRTWELPAELHERKVGAPITHDDLLGFHCMLDQPGWLEGHVTAMSRSGHPERA